MRDLIEESVQDYRRAVILRKAGVIRGDLNRQPALQPANYKCTVRGCSDRILIGMKDDKPESIQQVNRALVRLGWTYSTKAHGFVCSEHAYLCRQLDHPRNHVDASILR